MTKTKPIDLDQLKTNHQKAEAKADAEMWRVCYARLWGQVEALRLNPGATIEEAKANLDTVVRDDDTRWREGRDKVQALRRKNARERKNARAKMDAQDCIMNEV